MDICDILACPLCGGKMKRDGSRLLCERGHSYDVASAGYVNLLPPGKKNNAVTGDERAMVRARSDFLSGGYYDGISLGMADAVRGAVTAEKPVIADIGCGEGHHTCRIAEELKKHYGELTVLGVDASGYAAGLGQKLAGRRGLAPPGGVGARFRDVPGEEADGGGKPRGGSEAVTDGKAVLGFVAGNIFMLPMTDASADCMLSMFAPIPWDECRRVLKKNGCIVVAASGRDHLIELREVIYETVIKKEPSPAPAEGFELCGRSSVRYKFDLCSGEDVVNLFEMTPFKYKTTAEARDRLRGTEHLSLTAEVEYFVFRKCV